MHTLKVARLMGLYGSLAKLENDAKTSCRNAMKEEDPCVLPIPVKFFEGYKRDFQQLEITATQIPMAAVLAFTRQINDALRSATVSSDATIRLTAWNAMRIARACHHLAPVLIHEMDVRRFYLLEPADIDWLDGRSSNWGSKILERFPIAIFDITEANRCMAMGLPTAAVFHAMRVTEAGMRALRCCMGITEPFEGGERNWSNILRRVDSAIRDRGREWAESDFFLEISVQLNAVRTAWRNTTMHLEKTYGREDAERIISATKGLMVKISDRMDEEGNPRA